MRSEGGALEQSLATLEDEYGEIWDQILTLPYKVLENFKFTHLGIYPHILSVITFYKDMNVIFPETECLIEIWRS